MTDRQDRQLRQRHMGPTKDTDGIHVMTLLERFSCRCETSLGTARYVSSLVTDS